MYGKMLVGGQDAVLQWTGAVFRLQLGTGAVIFELRPQQIVRVRDDQRATLNFSTGEQSYQVYFPEVAAVLTSAAGLAFTPAGGLDARRNSALTSPVNVWLNLLRAVGVKVVDRSFVPPSTNKIVLVTLGSVFGIVLLVSVIAFIVIFLQQ